MNYQRKYEGGIGEIGIKIRVWYHKSPVEEVSPGGGKYLMYHYQMQEKEKMRMGIDQCIRQDRSHR